MGMIRFTTYQTTQRLNNLLSEIGDNGTIEFHSGTKPSAASVHSPATCMAILALAPIAGTVVGNTLVLDVSVSVGVVSLAGVVTHAKLCRTIGTSTLVMMDFEVGLTGSGKPITMPSVSFSVGENVTMTNFVITEGNLG